MSEWGEWGRRLFDCAEAGDAESARLLLESCGGHAHMFVNWVNDSFSQRGENSLMVSARKGHLEVLSLLLDFGADANAQDWNQSSALSKATRFGHQLIVDALIAHGAREPAVRAARGAATSNKPEWVDITRSSVHKPILVVASKTSRDDQSKRGPRPTKASLLRAELNARHKTSGEPPSSDLPGSGDGCEGSGSDATPQPSLVVRAPLCPTSTYPPDLAPCAHADIAVAGSGSDIVYALVAQPSDPTDALHGREQPPLPPDPIKPPIPRFEEEPAPSQAWFTTTFIDPKFLCTASDLSQQQDIRSHPAMNTYYCELRCGLHEAMVASAALSVDIFSLNSSSVAGALDALANLIGVPVASTVLSTAARAADYIAVKQLVAGYACLRRVNPSGDPVQEARLFEELARELTIALRSHLTLLVCTGASAAPDRPVDVARVHQVLADLFKGIFISNPSASPQRLAAHHCQLVLQHIFANKLAADPSHPRDVIDELAEVVLKANREGADGNDLRIDAKAEQRLETKDMDESPTTRPLKPPKPQKPPKPPAVAYASPAGNPMEAEQEASIIGPGQTVACCVVS